MCHGFGYLPLSHRAVRWVKGPAYADLGPAVYCTDGSGGARSQDPMLRRCGWGWVQTSPAGWGWASYGPLEGSSQSVPRAEMVAVIQVVRATTGDISIYTDHANIVSGMAKGHVRCAFLSNSDLWEDIWAAVRTHAGSVSVFKVPAHADVDAVLTSDVPREAIVGNYVADAVADRGAKMAELPDNVVQDYMAVQRTAELVLHRVVAVTVAAASVHKNPLRNIRPPSARPQPLRRLKQARRHTAHSVVAVARAWRCTQCMGMSPAKGVAAWFRTPCPGREGTEEALHQVCAPHPSHSLSRGPVLIWCAVCGA